MPVRPINDSQLKNFDKVYLLHNGKHEANLSHIALSRQSNGLELFVNKKDSKDLNELVNRIDKVEGNLLKASIGYDFIKDQLMKEGTLSWKYQDPAWWDKIEEKQEEYKKNWGTEYTDQMMLSKHKLPEFDKETHIKNLGKEFYEEKKGIEDFMIRNREDSPKINQALTKDENKLKEHYEKREGYGQSLDHKIEKVTEMKNIGNKSEHRNTLDHKISTPSDSSEAKDLKIASNAPDDGGISEKSQSLGRGRR